MVLMIDNYDSFTYNLVQYFKQLGEEVAVYRNDEITSEQALKLNFDYLVISPGPGKPCNSGCSMELIKTFAGEKPILGVCLGHQAIGEVFGGTISQAKSIMHGKSDMITHDGLSLFQGLPNPLRVVRYHSLAIEKSSLSKDLEITAVSKDGEIMGIRHKKLPIEGVQFHPESIGTEEGLSLLSNFTRRTKQKLTIKNILTKSLTDPGLSESEAIHVMECITEGNMTPAQIGSLLTTMAMRGLRVEELTGFTKCLSRKIREVPIPNDFVFTDTCGTGGDGTGTFNISTAAALVAGGAGVKVAKHGNRSITSRSGSADVLEELGVNINMDPKQASKVLLETGITFFFAPHYHPAFKNCIGPRRELGFRTIFNIIGPMLNPARARSQIIGVFSEALTEIVAKVLSNLDIERAFVVHGCDGMDEITLTGKTKITELKKGWIQTTYFDPREYGYRLCRIDDVKGGSVKDNAEIMNRLLKGEKSFYRDIVIINASAAIIVAGCATDFSEALTKATESIDSGAANNCLQNLIHSSNAET